MDPYLDHLHNNIYQNLRNNNILSDSISYSESCEVNEYMMHRTLIDEMKSPYFTYNQTPMGLNMQQKEFLLYTIYCAPIYASIKSSTSFAQDYWDYWRFHQKLSDKLLFSFSLSVLPSTQGSAIHPIFNLEFDNKIVLSIYRYIYQIINNYFEHFEIENSIIHPQEEANCDNDIDTLLVNMHDIGLMLFGTSRSTGDSKIAGVNLCPNSVAQQLFSIAQWSVLQ